MGASLLSRAASHRLLRHPAGGGRHSGPGVRALVRRLSVGQQMASLCFYARVGSWLVSAPVGQRHQLASSGPRRLAVSRSRIDAAAHRPGHCSFDASLVCRCRVDFCDCSVLDCCGRCLLYAFDARACAAPGAWLPELSALWQFSFCRRSRHFSFGCPAASRRGAGLYPRRQCVQLWIWYLSDWRDNYLAQFWACLYEWGVYDSSSISQHGRAKG